MLNAPRMIEFPMNLVLEDSNKWCIKPGHDWLTKTQLTFLEQIFFWVYVYEKIYIYIYIWNA